MAKKHYEVVDEVVSDEVTETMKPSKPEFPVLEDGTLAAYLVKLEDGYHIEDLDGNLSDVLPISKDGICVVLCPNPSNRKWFNLKKADAATANGDKIPLTYKGSKHFATGTGVKIPNDNLVKTYAPELYEEYVAIMMAARKAKADEQAKPKTELEKAQEKLEKAKAALAKLQAQAAGELNVEGGNN